MCTDTGRLKEIGSTVINLEEEIDSRWGRFRKEEVFSVIYT
jgi:hypothetical protein